MFYRSIQKSTILFFVQVLLVGELWALAPNSLFVQPFNAEEKGESSMHVDVHGTYFAPGAVSHANHVGDVAVQFNVISSDFGKVIPLFMSLREGLKSDENFNQEFFLKKMDEIKIYTQPIIQKLNELERKLEAKNDPNQKIILNKINGLKQMEEKIKEITGGENPYQQNILERLTSLENILREWQQKIHQNELTKNKLPNSDIKNIVKKLREKSREEVENDFYIQQGLSLYIPLNAADSPDIEKDDEENRYSLIKEAETFLDILREEKQQGIPKERRAALKRAKLLLLQGNSGSGKSLFGRWLEKKLWEDYEEGKSDKILLFISLPLHYKKGSGDLIETFLKKRGLAEKEIRELKNHKDKIVLFLDGYDEINDKRNVYKTQKLGEWSDKVIVTSRSQYLSESEIDEFFIVHSQDSREEKGAVMKSYLLPFAPSQMKSYVKRFSESDHREEGWDAKRYEEALGKFSELGEMVIEPFSLSLILEVLPSLEKDEASEENIHKLISRSDVYGAFIERWFKIQKVRLEKGNHYFPEDHLKRAKQIFQVFSEDLAYEMYLRETQIAIRGRYKEGKRRGRRYVGPKEWRKIFESPEAEIGLKGAPLKRFGNNQYMFIHKSYQEYFTAQKIMNDLIYGQEEEEEGEVFKDRFSKDYSINKKLLNDEPSVIRFIVDSVLNEKGDYKELKDYLFKIIKLSKTRDDVTVAVANAMTILNAAKVSFSGKDFFKAKLGGIRRIEEEGKWIRDEYVPWQESKGEQKKENWAGAILSEGIFDKTDFSHSDLRGVDFSGSFLGHTNFDGALMIGVILGENFFHDYNRRIKKIGITDEYIITLVGEKIEIRNRDNGKLYQPDFLKTHLDNVSAFLLEEGKIIVAYRNRDFKELDLAKLEVAEILDMDKEELKISYLDKKTGSIILLGESYYYQEGSYYSSGTLISDKNQGRLFLVKSEKLKVFKREESELKEEKVFEQKGETKFINDGIRKIALSGTGLIAVVKEDCIEIWDWKSNLKKQKIPLSSRVHSLAFTHDGEFLLFGGEDNIIRIWDYQKQRERTPLHGHTRPVTHIDLIKKEKELVVVSGSKKGVVKIWEIKNLEQRRLARGENPEKIVTSLAIDSKAEKAFSLNKDGALDVWDLNTGQKKESPENSDKKGTSMTLSRDGKTVSFDDFKEKMQLERKQKEDQKIFSISLERKLGKIRQMSTDEKGNRLIFLNARHEIWFWEAKAGLTKLEEDLGYVRGISLAGEELVVYRKKSLSIGSLESGNWQENQFLTYLGREEISAANLSGDRSKIILGFKNGEIFVIDRASNNVEKVLRGHVGPITSVFLGKDGRHLMSAGEDKTVRIWHLKKTENYEEGLLWMTAPYFLYGGGASLGVKSGDKEKLKTLKILKRGATALMSASEAGDSKKVKGLLMKISDEDLNKQNADGWTALMLASANGHGEVVESLLKENPDVNLKNVDGWTALMLASANGHGEVVKFLLKKNPDVNLKNKDGWTALMLAVVNGDKKVVADILEAKGVDVNQGNNFGWTALILAIVNKNRDIIRLLFEFRDKRKNFNLILEDIEFLMEISETDEVKEELEETLRKEIKQNLDNKELENKLFFLTSKYGMLDGLKELIEKKEKKSEKRALEMSMSLARALSMEMEREMSMSLARARVRALEMAMSMEMSMSLERALARARARALEMAMSMEMEREMSMSLARAMSREREMSMERALEMAMEMEMAMSMAMAMKRAVARALEMAMSMSRAMSLEMSLEMSMSRAVERAMSLERAVARAPERAMAMAMSRAREMERAMAMSMALEMSREMSRASKKKGGGGAYSYCKLCKKRGIR